MAKHTFIIAEAGVNHNGDLQRAYELVNIAKESGADAVKFQTFIAEEVVSVHAEKAEYQKVNTEKQDTQLEMIKKLELSFRNFRDLQNYCNEKGILFLSTAFDLESISFLRSLNLPLGKIPSGEITNLPYLEKMATSFPALIVSTGMCSYAEIESALTVLLTKGVKKKNITLLQCNTEYPTPFEDVNLQVMNEMRERFGVEVGYSDHTLGIEVPVAAVALGATIIEKHFTSDKSLPGPDHIASLDPVELKAMVSAIRNIDKALGSNVKVATASESKNITIARKSIHVKTNLAAGTVLDETHLTMKRPGDGISPMRLPEILGKVTSRALPADHKLSEDDIL